METKCPVCGKLVGGFSKKDVDYKMLMHMMKHRNHQDKEPEEKLQEISETLNSIKSQEVIKNGGTTE